MSDSHHEHISLHACIWYWCLAVNDYDVYIQYHCKLPQRYNDTSESEFWMLCRGIAAQFFPRNLWRRQASLSLFWNNLSQSTSVRFACTKKSLTSPIHWPLRGLQHFTRYQISVGHFASAHCSVEVLAVRLLVSKPKLAGCLPTEHSPTPKTEMTQCAE